MLIVQVSGAERCWAAAPWAREFAGPSCRSDGWLGSVLSRLNVLHLCGSRNCSTALSSRVSTTTRSDPCREGARHDTSSEDYAH
jgi:hypothetical protein